MKLGEEVSEVGVGLGLHGGVGEGGLAHVWGGLGGGRALTILSKMCPSSPPILVSAKVARLPIRVLVSTLKSTWVPAMHRQVELA